MNLRLNRNLFLETGANSAELGMLGTVVHRPRESGDYAGSVYRGQQQVGDFLLRVLDEETPLSVAIDLATQVRQGEARRHLDESGDCDCREPGHGESATAIYRVGRQGHVVFHVSASGGGYHVQLAGPIGGALLERREDDRGKSDVWSSRELEPGDLFAVTLLRPGTYQVTNKRGGEAKLRLGYPERSKTAYRPPEPQHVAVTDGGFEPDGFELQPMQGQVYEIQAPASISISLLEPEDREQPTRPDRAGPARYTLRRRMEGRGLAPRDTPRSKKKG